MNLLRELWRAAALPRHHFERLESAPPRPLRALLVAEGSSLVAVLVLALALMWASGADAYLPVLTIGGLVALLLGALQWGVGGLVLHRAEDADARAWEIVGWSWTPALFVSVSLLPAAVLVAVSSLPNDPLLLLLAALGVLGVLVWHGVVVRAGLATFAAGRATRAFLFYVGMLFVFPLTAAALILLIASL